LRLADNEELREILGTLFPGFYIDDTPAPSGQRVVYFGHFEGSKRAPQQSGWSKWGSVVLKVSAGLSAQTIAYLQREVAALRSINSRSFPKLYMENLFTQNPETEEDLKPKLYITIEEKLNANPLTEERARFNSEGEIAAFLSETIKSLKLLWLHKNKYVHRDLKPANILVRQDGGISIIDLGIIRESGEKGLTITNMMHGPCTPCYASPEQVKNDKLNISFRSDLFSLGVIGYELATGRNPFYEEDMSAEDVFSSILTHQQPPLAEVAQYSSRFSNLIDRLLGKEPYQRYRQVELVETELNKIIEELGD
jgi:eukaryotic-like serine/threonine-protein kinase